MAGRKAGPLGSLIRANLEKDNAEIIALIAKHKDAAKELKEKGKSELQLRQMISQARSNSKKRKRRRRKAGADQNGASLPRMGKPAMPANRFAAVAKLAKLIQEAGGVGKVEAALAVSSPLLAEFSSSELKAGLEAAKAFGAK